MNRKRLACESVEVILREVKNEDGSITYSSTIQAYPFGTYHHPMHGKLVMDRKTADEFSMNVNQKVTTTQLYIDRDHVEGPAEGWVTGAEVDGEGLNLNVEWTDRGVQAIKSKEYKYFSPYFAKKWRHPKTGIVHNNVLLGGGIVNRPFLRDINPLSLGDDMDLEALLKEALGDGVANNVVKSVATTLSETVNKEIVSLKDSFEEKFEEQKKKSNQIIAALAAEKKNADIQLHVGRWGKTLPVALHDHVKEVMKLSDSETTKVFIKFMDELAKLGSIGKETTGTDPIKHGAENQPSGTGSGSGESNSLTDSINDLMKKNPALSYSEAADKITAMNPKLVNEFRLSAKIEG